MTHFHRIATFKASKRQAGISLIIVMIMVVIIGLTSASAIRNATSGERATNNIRMQNLAQQYAEAALRFCEVEVRKGDGSAYGAFKFSLNKVDTDYVAGQASFQVSPAPWERPSSWGVGTPVAGDASARRYTILQGQIKSVNSSIVPTNLPQCVNERQKLADGKWATVVTARGFSPDYTFDATSGLTKSGSVVWLQSILLTL